MFVAFIGGEGRLSQHVLLLIEVTDLPIFTGEVVDVLDVRPGQASEQVIGFAEDLGVAIDGAPAMAFAEDAEFRADAVKEVAEGIHSERRG